MLFDERLEVEHHPRPALRIGRRPGWLRRLRRGHRAIQHCRIAEHQLRLYGAAIGIEHIAAAARGQASRAAGYEMVNRAHGTDKLLSIIRSSCAFISMQTMRKFAGTGCIYAGIGLERPTDLPRHRESGAA
jgi:nitroreductase